MPSWNCCVMNCKNNTHGPLRFFSFPKDEERRQLWAESCGRQNWYPTDLSRICEVHFDKSQFQQNQQDGNKLLKWSAIPRMYEEWTKEPTSPIEEHLEKSHEYDEADTDDFKLNPIDEEYLDDEFEGTLEPEWRKRKRLERKRASSDKLDSEEYQSYKTDKTEIGLVKRSSKKMGAFDKTDELEDELSRIKADIKRIMEDGYTKQASNPRQISPISAMKSRPSPGITMSSPPSSHKQYLQETNSPSLQFRRQLNQPNKTPAMKTNQSPGLLQKQFAKESSVGKTSASYDKQYPMKQMQGTEDVKNIIPSSQLTKKVESQTQSLEAVSKRNSLLHEILSNKKTNTTEKPWRAPDELVQFMNNTRVCFAPGEDGTLAEETDSAVGRKRRRTVNPQKTKGGKMQSSNVSKDERMDETLLKISKNPSSSSARETTEARITLPRIVKVQSLNLLKDAAETKGTPSKSEEAQSSNSSKGIEVIQSPSAIELENNLLKGARVKKVVIPRIIKVQEVGVTKNTAKTGEAQSSALLKNSEEITETLTDIGEMESSSISEDMGAENETPRIPKEQRNILSKDLRDIGGTSKTDETQSMETTEDQDSPEVPVRSYDKRSRSKTNGNVGNTPESKSARLKKLLASMLSIEEDMYSDEESDLEMLKKTSESTKKKKKKIEVGVQSDETQLKQIAELKAEISQLNQQLEMKNKTIVQLRQSLAAILPPGQIIMLSENDEKYVIFNQQKALS